MSGPLTTALKDLTFAIDPTPATTTKGLVYRPEFYIQHKEKAVPIKSLDYTKLSYRELISGMGQVAKYLLMNSGPVNTYLDHMNFVMRQAARHNFTDLTYVQYDRSVINRYVDEEVSKIVVGHTIAVASHFHAGNLVPTTTPARTPNEGRGRGRGYFFRQRKFSQSSQPPKDSDSTKANFEGFPDDLCFKYNHRSCTGHCSKQHVCRVCNDKHPASACPNKRQ